jgi:hypothetical protein
VIAKNTYPVNFRKGIRCNFFNKNHPARPVNIPGASLKPCLALVFVLLCIASMFDFDSANNAPVRNGRAMCQSSGNLYLVSGTPGMRESFTDGVDPPFSSDSGSRIIPRAGAGFSTEISTMIPLHPTPGRPSRSRPHNT